MNYNNLNYPHQSKRVVNFAQQGMVATSQPLAAEAGLDILKKGGNAIDAAIATAACLTVVEPTSNGIGGDAFSIIYSGGKLHGLNASGPSPELLNSQQVSQMGYQEMPRYGMLPITVPGAPAAWAEMSSKFGKIPFEQVLQAAINYARNGFPISPIIGKYWRVAFDRFQKELSGELYDELYRVFFSEGRPPDVGELWSSEDHAKTLELIASSNSEAFYRGELADRIDSFMKKHGGFLRKEDLRNFSPEWVDPISINYRGYDVWELPPNGQGLIALMSLNVLDDWGNSRDDIVNYHRQIEALKMAFDDGLCHITEPDSMTKSVDELLGTKYKEVKKKELSDEHAIDPVPQKAADGGTVYLAAADKEGNMVSFIQSNFTDFGSCVTVPETGIVLQNRGKSFSLDPNHSNYLKPRKRTYHTIIPGFLTKGDRPVGPFGVMGGFMQPQGHLQLLSNIIDKGLNPQAALDAPRWLWNGGKTVCVEQEFPKHIAEALEQKGHNIEVLLDCEPFGRGQVIFKDQQGVLSGATEPRTDGHIACY